MKRCLPFIVWFFVLVTSVAVRAETDAEVNARKDALDVAGAFSNDGFKIRDGHWCGVVKPHEHALVAVESVLVLRGRHGTGETNSRRRL